MPAITITKHAMERYQERVAPVSDADAMVALLNVIAMAKPKHLRRAHKKTFYIPSEQVLLVGTRWVIVTVVARD